MAFDTSRGKRRRGQVNGTQSLIYSIYHSAIRGILEEEPSGLNVSQIASRLPRMRDRILKHPDIHLTSEQSEKLPKEATSDRKTVRKHLYEMLALTTVRCIDGLYYPVVREEPWSKELRHGLYLPLEPPLSKELVKLNDDTLDNVEPQNWSFPPLENAAIFRTYVNPAKFRNRFDDFFGEHLQDFKTSLFFLDNILEHAIGNGLSPQFYNPTTGRINMRKLREGWARYFEDTKVIVWTYTINPRELFHFIETGGQDYLKARLAAKWDVILTRGRKRLAERRAMQRKVKKIQGLIAKKTSESSAVKIIQGAN